MRGQNQKKKTIEEESSVFFGERVIFLPLMIIAAGVQDWTGFVIVRFYFIFLLLCPAVN